MNENTNSNNCERAGELIAYFYGEAGMDERASFDAHLASCGSCRDELSAFAGVREAVGHWRAEILNAAPSYSGAVAPETARAQDGRAPSISHHAASLPPSAASIAPRTASIAPRTASIAPRTASIAPRTGAALAALRQFFTLSPVWMRAGMVAAALIVCALAALAVVNAEVRWDKGAGLAFSTRLSGEAKTAQTQPEAPAAKVYAQAELDKLVAERDAAMRELEDTRAQLDDSRAANLFAAVETLETMPASSTGVSTPGNTRRERRSVAAPNTRQQQQRRSADRDEGDAPRLYDLLTDAN